MNAEIVSVDLEKGVARLMVDNLLATCTIVNVEVLLTLQEAAKEVFLQGRYHTEPTTATVTNWIKAGLLIAEKIGGRGQGGQWRVFRSSIDQFVPPREAAKALEKPE